MPPTPVSHTQPASRHYLPSSRATPSDSLAAVLSKRIRIVELVISWAAMMEEDADHTGDEHAQEMSGLKCILLSAGRTFGTAGAAECVNRNWLYGGGKNMLSIAGCLGTDRVSYLLSSSLTPPILHTLIGGGPRCPHEYGLGWRCSSVVVWLISWRFSSNSGTSIGQRGWS